MAWKSYKPDAGEMEREPLLQSNNVSASSAVCSAILEEDGQCMAAGSTENNHHIYLSDRMKIAAMMLMFFTAGMNVTTVGVR